MKIPVSIALVLSIILSLLLVSPAAANGEITNEISSAIQLTENNTPDRYLQIEEGKVIWIGLDSDNNYIPEILLYDPDRIPGGSIAENIIRITNDKVNLNSYPQIDVFNEVVYVTWLGSDYKIYLWDSVTATPTIITGLSNIVGYPQIDSGEVTWVETVSWTTGEGEQQETHYRDEIFLYDCLTSTPMQITDNAFYELYPDVISNGDPQIDNGQVTWVGDMSDGNSNHSYYEIFLYNGSTIEPITNGSYHVNKYSPPLIDIVGDDVYITWLGDDYNIYLYDSTNKDEVTGNYIIKLISNTSSNNSSPQIEGGQITWRGYDEDSEEIFLFDGAINPVTPIQLTNDSYAVESPQIDSGKVTWAEMSYGPVYLPEWDLTFDSMQIWEIYVYNPDFNPEGSVEDNIAKIKVDGITYDGSTITFTNNREPRISGGQVTWLGSPNGFDTRFEIFLITLTQTPEEALQSVIDEIKQSPEIDNDSLESQLESAIRFLEDGKNSVAVSKLQAFVNHIDSLIEEMPEELTPEQEELKATLEALKADVESIIETIDVTNATKVIQGIKGAKSPHPKK